MYHVYISYSARDKRVAEELAEKLKRFRIPYKLAGTAKTERILVDEDLFAKSSAVSNYLIVICSLKSVNDPQISDVIRIFAGREPADHVIPYVISGTPNAANPENECFPEVMKQLSKNDLLASNVLELGKRRAFYRIIATICGIRPDELEKRVKRQEKRQFAVSFLVAFLIIGYIMYSEYSTNTRSAYYRAYEYVNNAPVGVERLPWIVHWFYQDYYIFRINEKQVLSIRRVGDAPVYMPEKEEVAEYYRAIDAPSVQFTYHTNGCMDAAIHRDETGNILFVMNYTAGMTAVDLSQGPDGIRPYYLYPGGENKGYSRCILSYDKDGYLSHVEYSASN